MAKGIPEETKENKKTAIKSDIDNLFKNKKKTISKDKPSDKPTTSTTAPSDKPAITKIDTTKKVDSTKKVMKKENEKKEAKAVVKPARLTEDGLRIYNTEELNMGKG